MKTYIAEVGYVFRVGEEVLGGILYTPDDFDDSVLIQVETPQEEI